MKFKVGDRVKVIRAIIDTDLIGTGEERINIF
jgi:hypothetical protein